MYTQQNSLTVPNNALILFGTMIIMWSEDYSEVFYGKAYNNERSI